MQVAARVDLLRVPAQRDIERNDVAMEGRFAHREEELLRVRHRRRGILAGKREPRDLVGDADQSAKEGGALDDRGVARCVRDRRDVLHEPNEELRAADRIELAVRRELRLHSSERHWVASLGHASNRAEDDAVLLAREVGGDKAAARDFVVEGAVHEHRAEERRFGLGLLRRRLDPAIDLQRHAGGPPSSDAFEKNLACSLSKSSWKGPVGPLRFFATEPLIRRGAPAGVSSRSRHSMITMSLSCSIEPPSRSVESFGSPPESPAARESCDRPITATPSSRARDLRFRVIVAISCTRFSSSSPVRMSWM